MERQGSFSQAEYAGKKKQTRRDKFLAEMERVVPWTRLVDRLRPFYPKGERGRPPIGLERMLRLYFLQQWYGLADDLPQEIAGGIEDRDSSLAFCSSSLSRAARRRISDVNFAINVLNVEGNKPRRKVRIDKPARRRDVGK